MTRRYWPETLDDVLAAPVIPHCPDACPYRELCPTDMQAGIASLFVGGQYTKPADCVFWQKVSALIERELGVLAPETPAELRAALRTVRRLP